MDDLVRLREATAEDLDSLEAIEAEGDALFADVFGPAPFGPDSTQSGASRAAEPGIVLVAVVDDGTARADGTRHGEASTESVVGFAHVREVEKRPSDEDPPEAHLEQLAVLPAHGRRGIGRSLVEAACAWAAARGHARISLRTYAEVPWNAPFYVRCGFRVSEDDAPGGALDTALQRGLVAAEREAGLVRLGRRVLMLRDLRAVRRDPPSPSS
ncbi:GNAT family N-acetyltransferase [Brachybacterium sp. ACRRE]|uniref:GNAT family N-acetyltransferase n=1 Tax=Brachybacterium sp. ACRRE TaxID=2918184 RepID=UPI001EF215EA|nr:GNAT family N-acetyltransferase [Brachybacterium sp. ACRRE]MCG7307923.1 GNAT family N-acetyltransferase [Brachybacterium sp. ACRRE]